jgi:hypothetical protein
MSTVKITLPEPHENQRQFLESAAKRRIIVAGRRGGKTTGMAMLAVDAMLQGRRVLEAAPTSDQTGAFWDNVTEFVAPLLNAGHIRKLETTRLLDMPSTGGRIRCKTAHNADTLRGDHADLLLLDEFSFMNADAWTKVGAPMLLDNDGDAVFIFTPNGHNHAYQLYNAAQNDDTGRWATWHFASMDNPYLSREALAEMVGDMPEFAYRQEILAMFLEDGAGVFRRVREAATAKPQDKAIEGHEYIFGVDWALSGDYTVITVYDINERALVYMDRFNQVDYVIQAARLEALAARFNPFVVIAESNSMGLPIIHQLRERLPIRAFNTTAATKDAIIRNLANAFDRGDIRIIKNETLISELMAYQVLRFSTNGMPVYGAPEGMHDDCVMSAAIGYVGLGRVSNTGGLVG